MDCDGVISQDPDFVDADGPDNTPYTEDDDYRLAVGSPCIDIGHNATIDAEDYEDEFDVDEDTDQDEPTPDLDLDDRVLNDTVDLGADEHFCLDCTDDGVANIYDLLDLLGQWDTTNENPPNSCDGGGACDYDGSGCVDNPDLLALLGVWGVGCPGQIWMESAPGCRGRRGPGLA